MKINGEKGQLEVEALCKPTKPTESFCKLQCKGYENQYGKDQLKVEACKPT